MLVLVIGQIGRIWHDGPAHKHELEQVGGRTHESDRVGDGSEATLGVGASPLGAQLETTQGRDQRESQRQRAGKVRAEDRPLTISDRSAWSINTLGSTVEMTAASLSVSRVV